MRSLLKPCIIVLAALAGRVVAADGSCSLQLATDPVGAIATVTGHLPAPTPTTVIVPTGLHEVRLSLHGWSDTLLAIPCDSGSVSLSVVLHRSRSWTDSVKSARADSSSRAGRVDARKALTRPAEDIPAALDALFAASKLPRDTLHPPALAVLPFQASAGTPAEAASSASETAILSLSRDRRWKLVERERFQSVLQEQALWGSGATSGNLEIGRALEARYLLLGTVATDGLRRLVAMRLVDATDGHVIAVGATRVDGPEMDAALQDALGERLGMSGAVFRSMVMPGWGQFWTERPVRGSFWLTTTLGLAGAFAWSISDWATLDNRAEDFKNRDAGTFQDGESTDHWLARANQAVSDRNEASDRNLILGSALAATWALNIADAAWCGWSSSRNTRSRYFAFAPIATPEAAGLRVSIQLGGSSR